MRKLNGLINEALHSVLPICVIVLLLSISIAPVMPGVMIMFLFGAMLINNRLCNLYGASWRGYRYSAQPFQEKDFARARLLRGWLAYNCCRT